MCKEENFSHLIEDILKKALKKESLKEAVEITCKCITKYYTHTQIVFAEKLGKRVSYIVGAGEETYNPSRTVILDEKYCIIMQNFSNISFEEEDILVSLFKVILAVKK
ncbi:hypothetical protein ACFIJ5_08765 [Haloimpatiens sp. FM7330]|uniref:hypothetical protein n=1 Tax=Haloimpatiens sp. FM7330 TaxID=3298610 RepID=UPI00363BC734